MENRWKERVESLLFRVKQRMQWYVMLDVLSNDGDIFSNLVQYFSSMSLLLNVDIDKRIIVAFEYKIFFEVNEQEKEIQSRIHILPLQEPTNNFEDE